MNKIFITPNEFQHDCMRLARQVYDAPWQPELLVALWRGGAIPGVIISEVFRYLGRPVAHRVIQCSSYTGTERSQCVRMECAKEVLSTIHPGMRVLVVDDVFDSGKTAEALTQSLAQADVRLAMVYWKPGKNLTSLKPNYCVHKTEDWIVFPHELEGLARDELALKDPDLPSILYPTRKEGLL